jgi:hypothetical protein
MLSDLHISIPLNKKKLFLECQLCVWMHACIYVRM